MDYGGRVPQNDNGAAPVPAMMFDRRFGPLLWSHLFSTWGDRLWGWWTHFIGVIVLFFFFCENLKILRDNSDFIVTSQNKPQIS